MSSMASWLRSRKDEITAAAALIGVLIGVIGFSLTSCQLWRTNETLQASNGYQIQKDARGLVDDLFAKQTFRDAVKSGLTAENEQMALDSFWKIFNFYLSVFRQSEAGGLSSEFVTSYRDDFCGFLRNAGAKQAWEKLKSDGRIGRSHLTMRKTWCDA